MGLLRRGFHFSTTELRYLATKNLIAVGNSNYALEQFANIRVGDYFYLLHGSLSRDTQGIRLLGRITSLPQDSMQFGESWKQCSYEVIKTNVQANEFYKANKAWTPYYPDCPIFEVPESDERDFEDHILRPYFGMKIRRRISERKSKAIFTGLCAKAL